MVVFKDKAPSPLALAVSAALAVTVVSPVRAQTANIEPDETLVVYGNPLYGMAPSEETGATASTRPPSGPRPRRP